MGHRHWLVPAATALSLLACYGTLAAVALLGALGITIVFSKTVCAGAIVTCAGLAVAALLARRRRHRSTLPVAHSGAGSVLIAGTTLLPCNVIAEIAGFVLLCAGAMLDWRRTRSGAEHAA